MTELLSNPYVSLFLVPVTIVLLVLFGWLSCKLAALLETQNHARKLAVILDTVGRKAGAIAEQLLKNPPSAQAAVDALKGSLVQDAAQVVAQAYPAFAPAVGFTVPKLATAISDEVSRQIVASGQLSAAGGLTADTAAAIKAAVFGVTPQAAPAA